MPAARKSLLEVKQLYLRMKNEIFGGGFLRVVNNSAALDRLLMKEFGTDTIMSDVRHPK